MEMVVTNEYEGRRALYYTMVIKQRGVRPWTAEMYPWTTERFRVMVTSSDEKVTRWIERKIDESDHTKLVNQNPPLVVGLGVNWSYAGDVSTITLVLFRDVLVYRLTPEAMVSPCLCRFLKSKLTRNWVLPVGNGIGLFLHRLHSSVRPPKFNCFDMRANYAFRASVRMFYQNNADVLGAPWELNFDPISLAIKELKIAVFHPYLALKCFVNQAWALKCFVQRRRDLAALKCFVQRRRDLALKCFVHEKPIYLERIGCKTTLECAVWRIKRSRDIRKARKMASHIVGYPCIGPKRELKFALESFWDQKSSAEDLEKVAADLRASIWKQMADVGIMYIPSNTFAYYDQVLNTTAMLGAVPPRYGWTGGEIGFDTYFSMGRGNATVPAMEMTKWFDTNYHFIVPELGPDVNFTYASHKAVNEYKEAKALGVDTVPVLVGPVTYLLLSKPANGVQPTFDLLTLLPKVLAVYKEVVADLKAAGASWIQFDEPTLVLDLEPNKLQAFTTAYSELASSLSGLNVLVETYFADIPAEAYKTLTGLAGITAYGFDLVRGTKTLDLIKGGFPSGKHLFAGVVDGRNIWANNLYDSLTTLNVLEAIVGEDKLVVSTSCSLLHTAVDLDNETKLDNEIKSWLAFAAQKVVEVNALAKALAGQKDEAFFSSNAAALASRKTSPRVTNEGVQKAAAALKGSDHRRATNVSARLDAQQKKLNLPVLPTTTIGSFPQTPELRRVRREYKATKISEEEYVTSIREEIRKVVELQEKLDIDVLVHGEPERNDMVEYFGEQLSGFALTVNGWVQSYGSCCLKPPIIYGDVSRPKPMTVFWSSTAQSMTKRPMKGMLTGPVTILNWSFVRNDQPRSETCYQIALAIKDEVEDLEKAGITVIQIDEAALREGLPMRKSGQAHYLEWAVHSFRITNVGVQDTTQIHTHMCYSHFNDIIHSIIDMDADVITIENSRSDEKLLRVFRDGVKYGAGIGPGVYDIHSPRIPQTEEIADRINKMLAVLEKNILWVNPNCGLKTRKYTEVNPALTNMVEATKQIRNQLASGK